VSPTPVFSEGRFYFPDEFPEVVPFQGACKRIVMVAILKKEGKKDGKK
jgi:hypothetical protein